ncbi:hypothetical protein IKJ53_00025 [bacterium]|nr:hypothetical protein [bacterium]
MYKNIKNIVASFIVMVVVTGVAFASSTSAEALNFFNSYVKAANSYQPVIASMYAPNAKIIRVVLKKDGTTVTRSTDTQRYISEMKKGQAIAKLRNYKNYYSNISVVQTGEDTYKVSSLRQPSGETYKLKAYMVVQKQPSGNWLIIEEMMQTKVQIIATAK